MSVIGKCENCGRDVDVHSIHYYVRLGRMEILLCKQCVVPIVPPKKETGEA